MAPLGTHAYARYLLQLFEGVRVSQPRIILQARVVGSGSDGGVDTGDAKYFSWTDGRTNNFNISREKFPEHVVFEAVWPRKFLSRIELIVAMNSVKKSSKSELSSRFYGRLKFGRVPGRRVPGRRVPGPRPRSGFSGGVRGGAGVLPGPSEDTNGLAYVLGPAARI